MTALRTMQFRYLFDPLCGWCYAAAPALAALAADAGDRLTMMPSGLFMDARPVATMADHAWRNDQRIESITGQRFTETYRQQVLLAPDGLFDSTALTRAVVALGELDHDLEQRFLHRAQILRYVDGEDTSRVDIVAPIAGALASEAGIAIDAMTFADRLLHDAQLRASADARVGEARRAMEAIGAQGVPQLVVVVDGRHHLINGQYLYAGGGPLMEALASLAVAA